MTSVARPSRAAPATRRRHARTCAISVDLDAIACYYRIHGLGAPPAELEHTILERALPRAATLFAARGIRVTWFVVGRDADPDFAAGTASSTTTDRAARAANAARLRALAERGDELGNHSYSHPYELARLSAAEISIELDACDRVLRAITGTAPRGFRAPGYDLSPAMLDHLARRGYRYDSSLFPAPGYYLAKAAVMAFLALARRPSGAVMTNPRALAAPPAPYRPAMTAPWRRGQAPVVELPIAVTPLLRVPAIGTSLLLAPAPLRRALARAMARRTFWNLELHGIDFADADHDGIPGELVDRQPDLRVPISDKLSRLEQLLDQLAPDWTFATLADVAADVQRDE
ncbi:MAG TPA: polysaccharide deacetylase family protein [Kofleriaceae bacterium]|nr:polysaccharide deacetylase family protein [Kofleriaceae bacterium]